MAPDTGQLVAQILNDAWLVRHYVRGGRSEIHRAKRSEAIKQLGITVRLAFGASDDFETLLAAVVDGLRPRNEQPF